MTIREHSGLGTTNTPEGPTPDLTTAPPPRRLPKISHYTGLGIWAGLILLFGLWVPHTFLTRLTFQTMASQQAVTAIVALGVLASLAAGVYDLSIAGVLGFSAVLVAVLTAKAHLSPPLAIIITVVVGVLIGLINAFLVVIVEINSFIATLAMGSLLVAPTRAVSNDQIVSGVPSSLTDIVRGTPLGVPIIAWYMLGLGLIVWYVLEHTPLGRRVAATGAGAEAARLAGVRTRRVVAGSLVTSSLFASIAGVLLAAKLSTATPDLGSAYLLPPFAAAFLGTTQIKPGRFNAWGTLLAIFLLATGSTGLQLAGAPDWVTDLFNGTALIAAVALSILGTRIAARRRASQGATGRAARG
jgi:ribose transport system permease protein